MKPECHTTVLVSVGMLCTQASCTSQSRVQPPHERPFLDVQYLEQPHSCVEMLLNDGEGLTLGPDSDALLNFCDMPVPAQTAAQPGPSTPAAEDKGKALAGTDDEVRATPCPPCCCHLEPSQGLHRGHMGENAGSVWKRASAPTNHRMAPWDLTWLCRCDTSHCCRTQNALVPAVPKVMRKPVHLQEGRKGSKKSNIDRLLTAGALSRTAPIARAPSNLQTTPRRFQLQACHPIPPFIYVPSTTSVWRSAPVLACLKDSHVSLENSILSHI